MSLFQIVLLQKIIKIDILDAVFWKTNSSLIQFNIQKNIDFIS